MSTVLVTGANRGLGLEFARQYAKAGWRVHATVRAPEKAEALKALGGAVTLHRLDVADFAAVAALGRAFEGESIDVLIANAGIGGPRGLTAATVAEHSDAWLSALRIDTLAPLALAGAFKAPVLRSEQRKMIAITSGLGSIAANQQGGLYAYRSAKAGLNAVWRSFALDTPDIIAVLLHPGWVRTDMGGPGAPLSAEQSVSGMRRVIAGLRQSDSGRFLSYEGAAVPW